MKIAKENLVIAQGQKWGTLYMVEVWAYGINPSKENAKTSTLTSKT